MAKHLTEKQCEAMRLVARGLETKEIARKLSLAPSTVDQRIDGARRKLGATTRKEAARRYLQLVGTPDRAIYEPIDIPSDHETTPSALGSHDDLRFEDALFDDRAVWDRRPRRHLPDFTPRDLGKVGRLLTILVLTILILATLGQLSNFAKSLGWVALPS